MIFSSVCLVSVCGIPETYAVLKAVYNIVVVNKILLNVHALPKLKKANAESYNKVIWSKFKFAAFCAIDPKWFNCGF